MTREEAYEIAEQKIEAARLSGAKKLDLSVEFNDGNSKRLAVLPESIGQLTQLLELNISNHQLTALPEWLGRLTQLQSLDLSSNELKVLPEWLGQLTQLQSLDISNNELKVLPECLDQLTQLQKLNVFYNLLTALPESMGKLTHLQELNISSNRLTVLPRWVCDLKLLKHLQVWGSPLAVLPPEIIQLQLERFSFNSDALTELPSEIFKFNNLKWLDISGFETLTTLPESIGQLTELRRLDLTNSKVAVLPNSIGNLVHLEELGLEGNRLADLPLSLAKLNSLKELDLEGNPLNPELAAVSKKGVDAVKRYLNELGKGGKDRFEAKLLILGDGNEGKTCVSRALRKLPFRKQNSTRGVDVVQWKFPHPDDKTNREKDITLNIWDFEGQEISHQTHQFFLSSQSLYILVFKCRDQFPLGRAEYWLDTIRSRAPKAKVAIVISQCEERSPHIPLDRIQAQYADMLAKEWFYPVGCENGKNVKKLQEYLHRSAADLEFMGTTWPKSYEKAEVEIKAKAKNNTSHITRTKLNGILCKAGVSGDNFEGAAGSLARIGALTQFPDCPDLNDFVVLKPQWLTKAVSIVMEDGQLSDDKGEIGLKRMETIWSKARYPGMFATFHNCMKEFELCYDLEDDTGSCLVPLRFGFVPPPIPWTDMAGCKERRMEYKLNVRPPMGIMSRFIVKTHHMIVRTMEYPKGIYWHNGVFLKTNSPCPSEALCEFLPEERTFRVQVRAAFPQNMCEQIHGYIQAVFSFFGGLSAERSYGCIKLDGATGSESQCKGFHTEKRIYTLISKQRDMMDCEFEEHEIDPRLLVSGISSFGGFVEGKLVNMLRREMDKPPEWAKKYLHGVGTLLEWVQSNSGKLDQLLSGQTSLVAEFKQEAELKLHEYLACMSQLLDDRDHTAAPGLILLTTKDRSRWNPANYFKTSYTLTPYCECEGNIHACEDGKVEFTKDKQWWQKTAPWIARAMKVLAAGLQLGFAGMPIALGPEAAKEIEGQLKLMAELSKHIELEAPKKEEVMDTGSIIDGDIGKDLRGYDREAVLTRAALARFLEETAPNNYRARRWGSLSRRRMSDNSYRWLCDTCAKRAG